MATPTPTTWTEWDGTRGMTYWHAVWTTTDNFSDSAIVDISGLSPAPNVVKVLGFKAQLNGDIGATLEYDATSDVLIYELINQTDSSLIDITDFTNGPNGGRTGYSTGAGGTGDIVLTTTNVASGDELTLLIFYEKKT